MRIAFKRPGFLFFRRMFFVKSVAEVSRAEGRFYLVKNPFGQMSIPVKDTVFKVIGKGSDKVVL